MPKSETTPVEDIDERDRSARADDDYADDVRTDDGHADDDYADDVDTDDDDDDGRPVPPAWRNKGFRYSVIATALVLAAGLSFGVGRAFGLGDTAVLTGIPAPLRGDDVFVESPDGIAKDNLSNIIESTGQGMVHVLSGGTPVGIGLVLTGSGKVLTTYQPSAGAASLAAKYVFSGQTFKATVIGVDPAVHLALLQMDGIKGRPFSTVTVGNSDTIVSSAAVIREKTYHVPGDILDTAVSTTGTQAGVSFNVGKLTTLNTKVTLGGLTWTGLMGSALTATQPPAIGAPLANPNGHVIGIMVGSSGSGLDTVGYAIPINAALTIARQMDN